MWNIRPIFLKNKGFTLIEVILALAITSMVILPIFSILSFSIKACDLGEQKDDLILNGKFAIEYIKDEIRIADRIISSDEISRLNLRYPSNIGFVIMIDEGTDKAEKYRYITYYMKDSELVRIACIRETNQYPNDSNFGGHNIISEFIEKIQDSQFDKENSMILLDFKLKHKDEDLRVKADIHIRCPIDY